MKNTNERNEEVLQHKLGEATELNINLLRYIETLKRERGVANEKETEQAVKYLELSNANEEYAIINKKYISIIADITATDKHIKQRYEEYAALNKKYLSTIKNLTAANKHIKRSHEEYAALNKEYLSPIEYLFDANKHIKESNKEYASLNKKYLSTIEDITATNKERRRSEERFRSIVEGTANAIISVDLERKITFWNEGAEKMFGYTVREIIGKPINILIPPESIDEITWALMKVKEVGFIEDFDTLRLTKNGRKIPVALSINALKDENGTPIGTSAIIRDISKQKYAEETLKERNDELSIFIYKSSHDLRSPLASILGLINVSKMDVDDKAALKYLDMIKDRIMILDNILKDLLRAAGIHKEATNPEWIDPVEILKEIVKSLENAEAAKNVSFVIKDGYNQSISTDKMLFTCVVQNIISNAINYHNTEISNPYVHISINGKGKNVVITIKDNGVGIPKDIQPKIFDMFYRGNKDSKGSGLGLYIVKKAVDKLKGEITMKSKPNKGTTFHIILPAT